ncbi:MFS transporter [Paraburkholderia humisilvae]|uniref:Inner membrane transport protein YnfM n=1 Tax=Paraburkholderia humisilvae TaxID=627669 RepID=A0A6J5EVS8_9BURK|nr:MFS transporter [Paraburkholderia humisilvae]CAB3770104.1 Inner membrane transport protein YnfM [Paraburkholderia humisilvae]
MTGQHSDTVEQERAAESVPPAQSASATASRKIEVGTAAFVRTNCALFAAGFATFALLYCVQPLMPLFSETFHVNAAGASLALSLTTGLLAVSLLVAGVLSETWGRKPMMVAALFLSAALTALSAVLPHWHTFLMTRAVMGIALSGLPAVAMAYVGEEMDARSLGTAMGLYVGGTGLGGMAGRLLTGVMTDLWGWRAAVMTMAVLAALSAVVLSRCLPASRHFVRRPPHFAPLARTYAVQLRDRMLPWLFAEGFLLMGAFVTVYNYVGYRLVAPPFSLSQTKIGLIFAVYLCGIFSSAWIGSLSGWLGRQKLLPATLGLMLLGTVLTRASSLPVIIVGIAVLTVGFFGSHSVASAWVGARAPVGKAQASSMYLFAYYAGSSVVGSLGGVFWSAGGWSGVTWMTGSLLVVAIVIALRLRATA